MIDRFTERMWQYRYCTSAINKEGKPTNILHDFYIPALERATRYDRVAGYFRSSSLAAASQGYTAFLQHDGHMRLIVGADLQIQDVAVILQGNQQRLSDRLLEQLEAPETWPEDVKNGVALLGEMISTGKLDIRIAFRVNAETGEAISVDSLEDGYVHEKWFIMSDEEENRMYGSGSLNESRTALTLNAENIDIHCDWQSVGDKERVDGAQEDFERLWTNTNTHMVVLSVPDAVKKRLVYLKSLRNKMVEIDGTVLSSEIIISPEEKLKFASLYYAPKMPGGEFLGMYNAPVSPWPHQEIVIRRLVESWPYSYLLCDEVGLGKTIEAALAIRSLILSGRVKRVLIVAPASLTEQWHRELAQKALLPFALSSVKPGGNGKYVHHYIFPCEQVETDDYLYGPNLNIVSSGLVRRKNRFSQLKKAGDFDIVLVDEAQYARRKNPRYGTSNNPKYGDLYIAVQDFLRIKAKALWLATATPMQIDPIEVYDLFKLTERVGQFQDDPCLAMEYFYGLGAIVNNHELSRQVWAMMGQSYSQIEKLDPFLWEYLEASVVTGKNRKVLKKLPWQDPHRADQRQLIQPLFAASPLSRVMMRHTRELLEIYRRHGKLSGNLAKRHVRPVCAIEFTASEAEFYEMLEEYCRGLEEQIRKYNPQTKQMMVFLLSFLQLRFASSFYAIQMTLTRRLKRVRNTLLIGGNVQSEEELQKILDSIKEDDEEYSEGDLDDITIDMLLQNRSEQDLKWEEERLSKMLEKLEAIKETPSKMQTLFTELDKRKRLNGRLRQTVLFTRFYDTLFSIRNNLQMINPFMRVGVYAGGKKASWFDPALGKDHLISHEKVKEKFLAGEIDFLLCTDAAAEGLNLQTADLLINFDLGWNPMKIEQRIGRIDHIGQIHTDIEVMNMCYVGSTEQVVYGRLLERLKQANLIVGIQQIALLPVTQEEFRKLSTGEMTPEELEKESKKKLEKQKEINGCIQMSAEDQYEMYNRMGFQMQNQSYPSNNNYMRDYLTKSGYLQECGSELLSEDGWQLPASDTWDEIRGTFNTDRVHEHSSFLTWGNSRLDQLLKSLGTVTDDNTYIRCISVPECPNIMGLAVSTPNGAELITSCNQIKSTVVDSGKSLTESQIEECKKKLKFITRQYAINNHRLNTAMKANKDVSTLHKQFISYISLEILKQLEAEGHIKALDAIRSLEINAKRTYFVDLPAGIFGGKATDLLFYVSENSGVVHVAVNEILLECVIELIKREVSAIHGKNSEKRTTDIIRRMERK